MKRPMPAFKQGDVIKVPFPCTDRPTRQSRPALVVSTGELEGLHGLLTAGRRRFARVTYQQNLYCRMVRQFT